MHTTMNPVLRLPNSCLQSLPDLHHVPLVEADLEGNRLMSLEGLPLSLEILNVSNNCLLEDGFFFPFPSLKTLDASKNRLNLRDPEEFTLCFPALETLNISSNYLRNIDFLEESPVQHLTLNKNRIPTLCGLPSDLITITAEECNVSMIQSRLPPRIESMFLAYNFLRFAGLPLNWPSVLRELHLDHNDIEKFPRKLPDSLEILTLNENKLTTLPSKLPSSLHTLLLCNNRIQYIPKLSHKLKILLLDNNCLTEAPLETSSRILSYEKNWTDQEHHDAQRIIRNCWKRTVLTIRLRHLLRTHKLREELFMISMQPDRWMQVDTIDPVWFRKLPCHNRTHPHSG